MSYCRWSCIGYGSDLYVYQSDRGWESIIAGSRYTNLEDAPTLLEFDANATPDQLNEWHRRYEERWAWLREHGQHEDLPDFPGGRFHLDDTPGECAARLRKMRAAGFRVPDYAIEQLEQEQAAAS